MRELFILFYFFTLVIQAQDYKLVDAKVKRYPKYNSAQRLATKIKGDFTTDADKIRATFIWLTENIRYDLEEYRNPTAKRISFSFKSEAEKQQKLQQIKNQIVDETFRFKKSVCEGYAQSFKRVSDLLNIEAVIIKGYARNSSNEIGIIPQGSNHAWNAVKIDTKWQLIDATWAAGYAINNQWKRSFTEHYFYPTPSELVRTHLPDNSSWQLLKTPVSKRIYSNQPLISQGFLSKNLTLIAPQKGIISAKKHAFKIKNLTSNDLVAYLFKGQQYGKKAAVNFNNGVGSFIIDLKGKKNSELYIFINNEIALEYKIK